MTTTKKQLLDQYNLLKKQADELETKIKSMPDDKSSIWDSNSQEGFVVQDTGEVFFYKKCFHGYHLNKANTLGLVFNSRKEAENHVTRLKIQKELLDLAGDQSWVDLNNDGQNKFYIVYDIYPFKGAGLGVSSCWNCKGSPFTVFFKTSDQALDAIKTLGEDKLKILFGVNK